MVNAVGVYSICRIKNVVIIFWSSAIDNFDGQGEHLPDSILSQQPASFLSLVTEKIK
jgi:hypothetical protein